MSFLKFFLPVRFKIQVKNNGRWVTSVNLRTDKEILRAMDACNRFLGSWRIVDSEGNVVFPEI